MPKSRIVGVWTTRGARPRDRTGIEGLRLGVKVLIAGLNFAPEQTGIGPYTSKLAVGLRMRGHEVGVITTFPHYPAWRVAEGYKGWTLRETGSDLPVTRVRHFVPNRPDLAKRFASEVSFGTRAISLPWGDPDVILCPSPALTSSALIQARARLSRKRPAFGVVVQDLYTAGIVEAEAAPRLAAGAMARLEGRTLRRADGVVVIHRRFWASLVRDLGVSGDRITIIRNWSHVLADGRFDRSAFRRSMGWGDETVVLHTGAMGAKQDLRNVVAAAHLAESKRLPIRFVLIGNGKERAELEAAAQGCQTISISDPLPDESFVKALRAADVLLVNEKPGVVEMAVPSKLTSYFSAGVAVLAATEQRSTTSDEVDASGGGVQVEPGRPEALVSGAMRLRQDDELRLRLGVRGRIYSEQHLSEGAALDAYDIWVRDLHQRKKRER